MAQIAKGKRRRGLRTASHPAEGENWRDSRRLDGAGLSARRARRTTGQGQSEVDQFS